MRAETARVKRTNTETDDLTDSLQPDVRRTGPGGRPRAAAWTPARTSRRRSRPAWARWSSSRARWRRWAAAARYHARWHGSFGPGAPQTVKIGSWVLSCITTESWNVLAIRLPHIRQNLRILRISEMCCDWGSLQRANFQNWMTLRHISVKIGATNDEFEETKNVRTFEENLPNMVNELRIHCEVRALPKCTRRVDLEKYGKMITLSTYLQQSASIKPERAFRRFLRLGVPKWYCQDV